MWWRFAPRSQLRDSPGIAPGSLRYAGDASGPARSLAARWRPPPAARSGRRPILGSGHGARRIDRAAQHRRRQGKVVGRLRGDGPGLGPGLAGRGGAVREGGKWKTGERKLADHLGIEWQTLGDGFTWESTDLDETAAKGRHAWEVAAAKLASGDYDLLILDELTYAISYGWVPVDQVVAASGTASPGPTWSSPGATPPPNWSTSRTRSPKCARSSTSTTGA